MIDVSHGVYDEDVGFVNPTRRDRLVRGEGIQ